MIKTGRHDTASFPEQRNHFFKRSRCFLFFRNASARRLLFGVIFHVFLEICQSQLLFSGQLFNGALPSHRLFSGRVSLIIYKSYRPFRLRVFRSITASVMCLQTFFQTVCPSCIQASVCAFQHICIIHRSVFFLSPGSSVSGCFTATHLYDLCKGQPPARRRQRPSRYLYKKQPGITGILQKEKQVGEFPAADSYSHLLYYTRFY